MIVDSSCSELYDYTFIKQVGGEYYDSYFNCHYFDFNYLLSFEVLKKVTIA